MTRSTQHTWLPHFAWLAAATTFVLLGLGGLVTSKGVGMAVPDWPTTYGYNMFLFPIRLWTGGIFYEHTHRLLASFVGLLTVVLAAWVWLRDARRWLRWLAVSAFIAVVIQGVLGGLRVTLYKDEIGIFHATLAQAFLVLLTFIALFTCAAGQRLIVRLRTMAIPPHLRVLTAAGTVLILAQLVLGATMRHQHAGLAVPDFPLAYGKLWPPMDPGQIERINQARLGVQDYKPITAAHIALHMAHRMMALFIVLTVGAVALQARRELGIGSTFARLAVSWLGLIGLQAGLGALTVWSNKAADIATAHVLIGALTLVNGSVLSAGALRRRLRVPLTYASPIGEVSPGCPLSTAKPMVT